MGFSRGDINASREFYGAARKQLNEIRRSGFRAIVVSCVGIILVLVNAVAVATLSDGQFLKVVPQARKQNPSLAGDAGRKAKMLVDEIVDESPEQELEVMPVIEDVPRTAYEDFVMFYPMPIAPAKELRLWSDSTGKFSTEAKLVVQTTSGDSAVKLEKEDGTTVTVFVSDLSQEDKDYLKEFRKLERQFNSAMKNWSSSARSKGVFVP